MDNKNLKECLKKADEFWEGMQPVEHTYGSFKTKDGSEIGFSTTTFKKVKPKTEDAEFEIITPKQIDNGKH